MIMLCSVHSQLSEKEIILGSPDLIRGAPKNDWTLPSERCVRRIPAQKRFPLLALKPEGAMWQQMQVAATARN